MTFEKQKCNITTNIIILLNLVTKPRDQASGPNNGTKPRDQTMGPSLVIHILTKIYDTYLNQTSGYTS